MATENLHVVTHDEDGWAVKQEGNPDPISTHSTQKDAVEAAVESGGDEPVSVTIHRRDGRIREVKTVTNNDSTTSNKGQESGMAALTSVGSRIRWGAVLAGFFVTMAISLALTSLGVAMSISLSNFFSPENLGIFVGVWVMITMLAALFVGGMTISQLTIGESDVCEPSIYGIVLWALVVFVAPLVPAASVDFGFGQLSKSQAAMTNSGDDATARGQSPDEDNASENDDSTKSEVAKLNEEPIEEEIEELQSEIATPITWEGLEGVEVAWMTFIAILISLAASISGAVLGSQMDNDEKLIAAAKS